MNDVAINILLVEDDEAHAKLIRRSLTAFHASLQLDQARSLREARRMLAESQPDLLIVDLKLPDGSGMELLPNDLDSAEIPVLVLTSQGDQETAVQAMKRGAIDYLVKSEAMFGEIGHVFERVRREWNHIVERRLAERALRQSEQRLANAQRVGNVGSWEWDLQADEVWWSDQFFEMLAVDREHFTPCLSAFLRFVVAEDRHKVCQCMRAAFAGVELHAASFRIQRSDDQLRFFASQGSLEYDEAGQPVRMVGTVHDATEQHLAQTQLIRAQRLASLGTLSAGLAHEINNPMSAAWIAAETARAVKDRPGAGEMLNECLDTIGDAVRRCKTIIENVLRFSRQESSEKQRQDLNEIVRLAAATTAYYTKTHGTDITLNLADDLPSVRVNSPEIEQVLVNLIRNAVQAGEATRISVSTATDDNTVHVRVSDNGHGIPDEDLEHIFDPFFTKNDGGGGIGLGLAISHSIIEDHEGRVEAESRVGQGSTFTVTLPQATSRSLASALHFEHAAARKHAAR